MLGLEPAMWAMSLQEGGLSAWRELLTPDTRAKHWPLTGQLQLCSGDTVGWMVFFLILSYLV